MSRRLKRNPALTDLENAFLIFYVIDGLSVSEAMQKACIKKSQDDFMAMPRIINGIEQTREMVIGRSAVSSAIDFDYVLQSFVEMVEMFYTDPFGAKEKGIRASDVLTALDRISHMRGFIKDSQVIEGELEINSAKVISIVKRLEDKGLEQEA